MSDALIAWQATGDDRWLEHVIATVTPNLERVVVRVLRRARVLDPAAVDDSLSLVFDHVRRLAQATPGERLVAPYDGHHGSRPGHVDRGMAYLVWLARERAHDVARMRRRQARHVLAFVDLQRVPHDRDRTGSIAPDPCQGVGPDCLRKVHAAIDRLEPRLRTVIQLLLDGKSQAAIAHMLGVCEGTVSRLRSRAIAELRQSLS